MDGLLMEMIEDLVTGIVGGDRLDVAAYRVARRIHAGNDGKLRIGG